MAQRGFSGSDQPPREMYDQCVRCGLCLPSCPTYVETLIETSSPRGRIALIKSVAEGMLDLTNPGFVHQMSECLDCRACEAACPSGVEYGQLLGTSRTQVQRVLGKRAPFHVRMFRRFTIGTLFSHYALLRFLARLIRFYQRSGLGKLVRRSGILTWLGLVELEALTPEISSTFFKPTDQHWSAVGESRATAFLHVGCVMHVAFAEVDKATVRMLQRVGCNVVAPKAQGCCGALAIHAGEMDRGRLMAKRNIMAFEASGADLYVINAAGCGSTLKEYVHLFADDREWSERARRFSHSVRDITELLDVLGLPPGMGQLNEIITYQEPCHLVHAQRISAAPRRLLQQIPGLTLREMPESSLCCGSAGIYNLTQPVMARQLQKRKVANVVRVEPTIVVTANPGCALQLKSGLNDVHAHIRVKHIVELLDEAYSSGQPPEPAPRTAV